MVKDYVYCCGGIANTTDLETCERFSLKTQQWTADVPAYNSPKYAMTMLVIDTSWLYTFGGSCMNIGLSTNFTVERLNTDDIGPGYS